MISHRIFSICPAGSPPGTLAVHARRLLEDQRRTWPQCGEGYAALDSVTTRDVACNGFDVKLQYNPRRIVSTGASVDPGTIRHRPCFLCVENLPPEQRGILYQDDFLILCNPAPIFREHFTISHLKHRPQILEPHLDIFFQLARELSPLFSIFYNGPRCGASAPDHIHFQACPAGVIPVEQDARDARRRQILKKSGSTAVATLKEYGRSVLVYESTDAVDLKVTMRRLQAAVQERLGGTEEPMMNAICAYRDGVWRLIVFLRSRHRPEVYFKEGEERVLISPASVDIGGLIITPVQKDFDTIDAPMVEQIFREVSLPMYQVREILGGVA